MMEIMSVTIIIPCRNEEKHIGPCLDSILANDYPKDRTEILVVDGMSEDRTREIVVKRYCARYPFIRLLDNPKLIQPCALNIGIRQSKSEVIVRMDAHSEYPAHFISKGIETLDKAGADVVGGPIVTMPGDDTIIARGVALVTSHPFGVGNSKFRTSIREGFVDTVPFGVYRRCVFDRVGFFDERLVRNEDNELHSRIIKSGGKIYLTPELTANYYNQSTIHGLAKQAFKTGMWNILTIKINPGAFCWRHFVPFIFVTIILILVVLALLHHSFLPTLLILFAAYFIVAIYSSIQISLEDGFRYLFILPVVFFLYHFSYGLGTWKGVIKIFIHSRPKNLALKGKDGQ